MTRAVTLDVGATTDVGLHRKVNEDSHLAGYPVFTVADGMGGHEAGDKASQAVVAVLSELVGRTDLVPDDLTTALDASHAAVRVISDDTGRGAGSTVTGVVVVESGGRPHWLVFNIGDSRVYRFREAQLDQLTSDHSVVQGLIDSGQLTALEAETYKGRNVITKAVGADDSAPDFWLHPIVAGERLLICSDGLTGEVTDAAIIDVLATSPVAQQAADRLVSLALAGGGRDNVTVIVLGVTDGGADPRFVESTGAVPPVAPPADDLDEDTIESPRVRAR